MNINDTSRIPIYREIDAERLRQAKLHPADEIKLELFKGTAVLSEEAGEVCRAALDYDDAAINSGSEIAVDHAIAHLRAELIQSAAVTVKLIELLDAGRLMRAVEDPDSSTKTYGEAAN